MRQAIIPKTKGISKFERVEVNCIRLLHGFNFILWTSGML
jgi:hypothetical protein